jgi:uncharacterized protein
MEPRKVIGSVDASEFIVALGASVGFLLSLGTQDIQMMVVAALLVDGLIAAPVAAYVVRHVAPRMLGTAVGGMIVFTNSRTVLDALNANGAIRGILLAAITVLWIGAIAAASRDPAVTVSSPARRRHLSPPWKAEQSASKLDVTV